jgi:hypothetical protein
MSQTIDHAKRELKAAGLFDKDSDYGGMLGNSVMSLIRTFSKQGHSGFSANMCVSLFGKLAKHEPLGPLTGKDEEWTNVANDLWQNKRCGHVFKDCSKAWDNDAIVFKDKDGCCYTNSKSRKTIRFPYSPKTKIVKRAS